MKKTIACLCLFIICLTSIAVAAPTYYNYKKEAFSGPTQINFTSLDMKNLKEVELTFVGMEYNAQGFADFIALDKPVTLYASCSTDLRVRYKNRPSYEYDAVINKKDIHFKAKNYFYWNSYLQLMLLPDKKHDTNLRCKFNGIENTLSSYIVEKAANAADSRTFKFIKRVPNKVESQNFVLASTLKEIPAPLKYCASNLMCCTYNIHFGSAKPLFKKRGNPNEVKDVTITFFAAIKSLSFNDGNKITYTTAPRPKNVVVVKAEPVVKAANKKNTSKSKVKPASKSKTPAKGKNTQTAPATAKSGDKKSSIDAKELAPRTDAELDDDLVAEVIFISGAENSLKDESSIAPRTDSQLDDDLVGD
jgi:hypothetical protein